MMDKSAQRSSTVEFVIGFVLICLGVVVALGAAWTLLHVGWYVRPVFTVGDVPIYERYGNRIEAGDVPYADFRVEYPPLALPAFVVPALLSDTSSTYRAAFQ